MVVLSQLSEGSSSSSPAHDGRVDVFLSCRGCDTRNSFTAHLHKALQDANITAFLDDEEIESGRCLEPKLEAVIKASRASIIVLSENYASSTWCLDELVLILEQHRNYGYIVIPIFYHVDPSSFEDAIAKHKQWVETEITADQRSQWNGKIELWKKALSEIADLRGKDAKGRRETVLIEELVKDISHRLGLDIASDLPLLIGVDSSIKFITTWLKAGSSGTVDILTIYGISGIGKTSLATYVYGLHRHVFDNSSFLQDISRRHEKYNGIVDLQKQLCEDLSKSLNQRHDVSVCTSNIANTLASEKFFLVLDDIDSFKQLDSLLGSKDFYPGSKVIITTKEVSLIESCALFNMKVSPTHTKLLLQGLNMSDSLKLLCIHAFMCNNPKEGYEDVARELVKYCAGHPLTLEVLGKLLRNQDVAYWKEHIKRLKEEKDSHMKNILRMSFDSLEYENDKNLFLDIACFFVGKDRNYTETILKGCGFHTLHGISNLIERCLLMIGPSNEFTMHQLIQEMARDTIRQEALDKPWKRSRLWCHEESFKVLKQKKGKGTLLGLALDMKMLEKDKLQGSFELDIDALSKMHDLMLLQLNYVQLSGSRKNFPEELRWLCMHGFPLKSVPSDLPMKNLVALDMSYSTFESFDMSNDNLLRLGKTQMLIGSSSKDNRLLGSLKILNLSSCKQLRSVGGFYELPALEMLILANCIGLIEICESIEQCDELALIDLSYCTTLKKLPRCGVNLKKFKTLTLDGCSLGEEFPNEVRNTDLPEMLNSDNLGINSQTSSSAIVGSSPTEMSDTDLLEMPNSNNLGVNSQTSSSAIVETRPRDYRSLVISLPSSLVYLSLKGNNLSDESFPMDLSSLSMLKELHLDCNPIVSLPIGIRSLSRLEKLSMVKCLRLKTFEHPPLTLKHLKFDHWHSLQKIVFDQEMSPLTFSMDSPWPPYSGLVVEGLFKIEAMSHVAEEVSRRLGWSNLEFINIQLVETKDLMTGTHKSQVQMVYEFGIFSTWFKGKEIPNWISDRRWEGSSISFTIPSSPNNLRGLNICFAFTNPNAGYFVGDSYHLLLSSIRISNITENHTWIYNRYNYSITPIPECVILLSHWMLGKNDIKDGDQVTITVRGYGTGSIIRECGVSFVYDDDDDDDDGEHKMEEDVLDYYKSWNHIIGGDLSAFLTTRGEYLLDVTRFFGWTSLYCPFFEDHCYYEEKHPTFRAFSPRKSNVFVKDITE
ncbi:TMV resistance protein N-like [Cynara cardunculus var. scolymus]|uniref:TMV resistance protein N-like n=1 Tax=Cynara cardunculus var. scolymus TaxID=59895 RepID=UPI000D6288FC|nr:TMV resistance protein N-like [Cynara cardunculus var. scolymus]